MDSYSTAPEQVKVASTAQVFTWTDDNTTSPGSFTVTIDPSFLEIKTTKLQIDWDNFEGIELKIGDERIMITKKELEEVMVKLLPGLLEKLILAKLVHSG